FSGDLLQQFVGYAEGIVIAGHENASLQIDDAIIHAAARARLVPAEAGRAHGIVGRPQQASRQRTFVAVGRIHVLDDLALVPDVVAGGDDIDAELEQLFGNLRSDPEAAGGILTISDG